MPPSHIYGSEALDTNLISRPAFMGSCSDMKYLNVIPEFSSGTKRFVALIADKWRINGSRMLLTQMPLQIGFDFESHATKLTNMLISRQMFFSRVSTQFIATSEFQTTL